jgi:Sulfatase
MTPPNPRLARLRALDWTPLLVATALSLTLLVLVPAQVYLVNRSALLVFFPLVLLTTSLLAAGLIGGLTGLLALLPGSLRRRVTVLLLGVTFLCWLHAYCLVWPYAVLDGGAIPWGDYTRRSLIDGTLWVLVLGPLLYFTPRVYPLAGRAGAGLLVLQVASLGISALRAEISPLDFFKHYYVEKQSVFEFSPEQNVIVIVLDEFQTDVFAEAVLPHAGYRAPFTGFTYFPDTVAGANFTELAIPAILTGQIYDNHQPRDQFLRQAYLGTSLPATLKRRGFDVHLFPWRGFANESIYYHESVATNFKRRPRPLKNQLADVARLIDLGLFRSAPQFAKPFLHNGSVWRVSEFYTRVLVRQRLARAAAPDSENPAPVEIGPSLTLDNVFLGFIHPETLPENRITTGAARRVFKTYHLAGLHVPVKMKRDFTKGIFDYTRANFSEQAEAYAKIVGAFLERLKQHGLYDNSLIVIVGDHGSGRAPDLYVQPAADERTRALNATAGSGDFQRDKARGLPLLLVKRFGAKGEIKTSRAPASVVDIPATILAELQLPAPAVPVLPGHPDFHGVPLFSLREKQARTRYYGAMEWAAEKSDYVSPITLYRVQGDSWTDEAWSFVETLDRPPGTGATPAASP